MSKSGTAGGTVAGRAVPLCHNRGGAQDALPARDPLALEATGLRALLTSERSAAWLPHRVPTVAGDDPIEAAYDDASGTRWTSDLVHCRIWDAGRVLMLLPAPRMSRGFGSIWRQLAPASAGAAPPKTDEISRCWWTADELAMLEPTDRFIAYGFMLHLSTRRIESALVSGLCEGAVAVKRSRISQRYAATRDRLAERWNKIARAVDAAALEVRQGMLERRFK